MESVRPLSHPTARFAAGCALAACVLVSAVPGRAEAADPLDSLRAAPVLDLVILTRATLSRNSSLGALRAARRALDAKTGQAGGLMDPMLEGMAAPRSFGAGTVDPAWAVSLSQRLPIFGQRGLERRVSRFEARAAAEDVRSLRLDVAREARRLYYRLYEIARAEAVTEQLRALVEQFRRVALQKYAAGTVGQADALQAEAELSMLDHERVVLARERRIAAANMKALLHDESPLPLPDPPATLPPLAPPAEGIAAAGGAPVDPLPAVRSREAMHDARVEEHRLARRARLPELTLTARYDRFMDEEEWRPIVGIGLNLPIWRGRLKARVREARALIERAERERDAARDLARSELEGARARVEETGHEVHILETGVLPAIEKTLVSVRAAYEASRGDFLALLSAERDVARARLSHHRAEAAYRMALADWEWASGVEPAASAGELDEEGSR